MVLDAARNFDGGPRKGAKDTEAHGSVGVLSCVLVSTSFFRQTSFNVYVLKPLLFGTLKPMIAMSLQHNHLIEIQTIYLQLELQRKI